MVFNRATLALVELRLAASKVSKLEQLEQIVEDDLRTVCVAASHRHFAVSVVPAKEIWEPVVLKYMVVKPVKVTDELWIERLPLVSTENELTLRPALEPRIVNEPP